MLGATIIAVMGESSEGLPYERPDELGMDRPISRRDFLDGATMAAAVGCFSGTPGNGTGRTRTIDADDVLGPTLPTVD